MESLKERNAFFIEVLLQRPEEARSGYDKKVFIRRACNGKREIAPKKNPANCEAMIYIIEIILVD